MSTLVTWTRADLLRRVAEDEPEASTPGLRILASPAVVLALMDYVSQLGQRAELVTLHGDPTAAEIRFYRRDCE